MGAVAVAHEVTGPADAPVVVLSNSLGSTRAMWDPQVDALAESFRVVRYDTRGHGDSPTPPGPYSIDDLVDDVVALLDSLDVDRAHVVGLSLGGATAMRLAATHPDRVDRVALLCTAAHFPPASAWTERASLVRTSGTGAIAEAVVQRWITADLAASHPDLRADLESMVAATPDEGYAGCCEALASVDLRADLPTIAAPVLAVAGADDPATPPSSLAEIVDGVPAGSLLVLDRAAHLATVEQPDAVTGALLAHLTGETA